MPEKIDLSICVPTSGSAPMGFTSSVVAMFSWLTARGIPSRPGSELSIQWDVAEGPCIHGNRESLVAAAIKREKTHILFLDHDMVFEPQVVDLLFSRRHPVVAVNYRLKDPSVREFVAVGLDGNRVETNHASTGLLPIAYSGFGVSLFETEVFKKTPQPWFAPEWIEATKGYTTEDNPCYRRIREAGVPVYLDQDASKLVRHVGSMAYSWDDVVAKKEQ